MFCSLLHLWHQEAAFLALLQLARLELPGALSLSVLQSLTHALLVRRKEDALEMQVTSHSEENMITAGAG